MAKKNMTAAQKEAFVKKMARARKAKSSAKAKASAKPRAKSSAKAKPSQKSSGASLSVRVGKLETTVRKHGTAIGDLTNVQTFMFNEMQRGGLFGGGGGGRDTRVDLPRARGRSASAN